MTMLSETIILQSAGSLSVAALALLMMILQALFFFRRPQFTWYVWGAAISFSALLYALGIFVEYNTPQGPLNRFSGLLEWTAVIFLVHTLYGFTFSFLGINSRRYHPTAGVFHGIILILLWSTDYLVADTFVTRSFMGLRTPYVEPALGPLGPLFILYVAAASVNAMIVWIRHKGPEPAHWIVYLIGITVWIVLGIHDGLAAIGLPTFQYFMEYGFLGFAVSILWVTFSSYLEVSAQEKYRVISQFANDCILVIQDRKIIYGNAACSDLTGRPVTDSGVIGLLNIMGTETRRNVLQYYKALLEDRPVAKTLTLWIRAADGKEKFVEIASNRIQYGNRPAVLSVIRDMTERKRAEEILRESEEKYRSMMEAMGDAVYISSPDFRIQYMNPSMIQMVGRDATGEFCHKALFDKDEPCPWCLIVQFQPGDISETEIIDPKDNRSYHVTHSPIFHQNDSISHMFILKDTTLTKQLQNQLLRSERLSATGQLAATIAHEINSPLQGIASLLNSIERTQNLDDRLSEQLNLIKRAFTSIRDTVKKLLDLSRPGKEVKQSINVNKVIEDTVGLLNSHLRKNQVRVQLDLASTIPNIQASPQQLSHVFMNLISNAIEAMTGNGTSENHINTENMHNGTITIDTNVQNDILITKVVDTGPGISEADMEHLFDPFYTRKKELGMGIGLSLCHSIIHDHHGTITARNAPEGGAVFTITLPLGLAQK
ncbi:MAG: ATP-binding protein [Desulfobacteraceae bacterium]